MKRVRGDCGCGELNPTAFSSLNPAPLEHLCVGSPSAVQLKYFEVQDEGSESSRVGVLVQAAVAVVAQEEEHHPNLCSPQTAIVLRSHKIENSPNGMNYKMPTCSIQKLTHMPALACTDGQSTKGVSAIFIGGLAKIACPKSNGKSQITGFAGTSSYLTASQKLPKPFRLTKATTARLELAGFGLDELQRPSTKRGRRRLNLNMYLNMT